MFLPSQNVECVNHIVLTFGRLTPNGCKYKHYFHSTNKKAPEEAVNYGAAHGALAMTTPGDTSMATLKEVEAIMKGKGARVIR
jgi:sugar/nucleoside kinase (ribokinase family)